MCCRSRQVTVPTTCSLWPRISVIAKAQCWFQSARGNEPDRPTVSHGAGLPEYGTDSTRSLSALNVLLTFVLAGPGCSAASWASCSESALQSGPPRLEALTMTVIVSVLLWDVTAVG